MHWNGAKLTVNTVYVFAGGRVSPVPGTQQVLNKCGGSTQMSDTGVSAYGGEQV